MAKKELKHLFISMPMFGLSEEDIVKNQLMYRKRVEGLTKEEYYLIDNIHKHIDGDPKDLRTRLKMLADSLAIMSDADLVYFAPGWEDAKGCKIEYECAKAYGLKMIVNKKEDRRKPNGT